MSDRLAKRLIAAIRVADPDNACRVEVVLHPFVPTGTTSGVMA